MIKVNHEELTRPSRIYCHELPRGVEIYESYMNNNSTTEEAASTMTLKSYKNDSSTAYEDNSAGEESTHCPSTEVTY